MTYTSPLPTWVLVTSHGAFLAARFSLVVIAPRSLLIGRHCSPLAPHWSSLSISRRVLHCHYRSCSSLLKPSNYLNFVQLSQKLSSKMKWGNNNIMMQEKKMKKWNALSWNYCFFLHRNSDGYSVRFRHWRYGRRTAANGVHRQLHDLRSDFRLPGWPLLSPVNAQLIYCSISW